MTFQLQSFLVAAIVAAILFADRLDGGEAVSKRLYQVAIGFALVFLTFSATNAFLPQPETPNLTELAVLSQLGEGDVSSDSSNRAKVIATIHSGVAFALVIAGIAAFRRYQTLSLGVALGGVLLLLASGSSADTTDPTNALNSIYSLFGGSNADQAQEVAYLGVILIGTAALLAYGFQRWDRAPAVETTG